MNKYFEFILKCLKKILKKNYYITDCIEKASLRFDKAWLKRITFILYGVVRNYRYYEYYVKLLSKKEPSFMVKNILIIGMFLIDNVEGMSHARSVFLTVDYAKKLKGKSVAGFVNAVLKNFIKIREEKSLPPGNEGVSIKFSMPLWMFEALKREYGEEDAVKIARYFNKEANVYLKANTNIAPIDKIVAEIEANGFAVEDFDTEFKSIKLKRGSGIFDTPFYKKLWVIAQDRGSIVVEKVVNGFKRGRHLEVCSGKGIKLLSSQKNSASAEVAFEINQLKLKVSKKLIEKWFKQAVESNRFSFVCGDATESFPFLDESFDTCFIDAPCTGSGTIRRKPEIKWKIKVKQLKVFSEKQLEVLQNSAEVLKTGGVLLYSVCSVFKEEAEDVVFKFLKFHPNFETIPLSVSGYPELSTSEGFIRIMPWHFDSDSFFLAALRKNRGSS